MRILIIGAYGFIGSHIAADLRARGHEVIGAGRDNKFAKRRHPDFTWVHCDLNHDTTPEAWLPRLEGVDAVINAAGILQDTVLDSSDAIHHRGPAALFEACERAGVGPVIQISALGAGDATGTAFGHTKASGDTSLQAHDLNWIILRPSLVYARGTFGGTTMIRGLAGFPFIQPTPAGEQIFSPIHVRDLADVVARLCEPNAPSRAILDLVGPEQKTLGEITSLYRRWLGFGSAPKVVVPRWVIRLGAKLGDVAGYLGSRTSLRTTALKQMEIPNTAPMDPLVKVTGFTPRTMEAALAAEPADVQDRWHARLIFLKPLARMVLALFWIASGLVLFDPVSFRYAAGVLLYIGLPVDLAGPLTVISGAVDVGLGTVLLLGRRVRLIIFAMIAVSLFYIAVLTVSLPGLWLELLGTLTKIIPLIVLMLIVAAIEDER